MSLAVSASPPSPHSHVAFISATASTSAGDINSYHSVLIYSQMLVHWQWAVSFEQTVALSHRAESWVNRAAGC